LLIALRPCSFRLGFVDIIAQPISHIFGRRVPHSSGRTTMEDLNPDARNTVSIADMTTLSVYRAADGDSMLSDRERRETSSCGRIDEFAVTALTLKSRARISIDTAWLRRTKVRRAEGVFVHCGGAIMELQRSQRRKVASAMAG